MSLTSLAAAATLVLATAGSVPATPPTPPPPPTIVVQICIAVNLEQVDDVLAALDTKDLVGQLAPLGPVTEPTKDGLVVSSAADLADVRNVLNCGTVPTATPTATPAPTTDPVATTTPAVEPTTPAETTTEAPATTIVVPAPQVTTIPIGGVATGDGSTAP